ncbi:MAG: GNAT family N-acetyltransferase [Promethearchaeota archaeon]
MLKGKKINLHIIEKEDIPTYAAWMTSQEFVGEFFIAPQISVSDIEKRLSEPSPGSALFIIESKNGTKSGWISYYQLKFGGYATSTELGYMVTPEGRGKGYCTEAVAIILDYLYLLQDINRIQALIAEENVASKRVLEKNGFKKEGVLRRLFYSLGKWWDISVYSILREEWGSPKILKNKLWKE